MNRIQNTRFDNVLLQRDRDCRRGSLELTKHHLVFRPAISSELGAGNVAASAAASSSSLASPSSAAESSRSKDVSIPYALLTLVTRQPSLLPLTASGSRRSTSPVPPSTSGSRGRIYPLQIRLRTFQAVSLGFESEAKATEAFESLKTIAIILSPDQLYAFYYTPSPPNSFTGGWKVYDFREEMARQGVGSRTKAWRFTDVNAAYEFCPTYPALMAVPSRISDATLQYAAKYRSKGRIPALTYLHWANNGSITRCAQPLPGIKQARSVQDEKVVEAIFNSHLYVKDAANSSDNHGAVYGATSTNVIIDARPTTNAMATYARGGGTENMDHYRGCRKAYMGIENIHVMRDSINRVVEALRAADEPTTFGMDVGVEVQSSSADRLRHDQQIDAPRSPGEHQPLDMNALRKSGWLKHTACLLGATALITKNIHIASSHVLIHCSDGWDRTSQLAALAEVCLDPFYRTMKGFAVLVEKDWLSFGHRFADRCGHGGSEKYFVTAAGRGDSVDDEDLEESEGALPGGAQAAANAFWGFTKQLTSNFSGGQGVGGAHIKETSPVFTQFLECVWQIMRHYPQRFEFNEQWLVELHKALYECRFGSFLANCERERKHEPAVRGRTIVQATHSVWDYMLSEENTRRFTNPKFDKSLDDPKREDADMGVLIVANTSDVRWWPGLFGRRMEEANQALDFEESERKRRKAEKARWDAELAERRQAERLAAEEEAKKKRGLEAAARGEENGVSGDSNMGGTSRISANGAVDLVTASKLQAQHDSQSSDPSRLNYQPRMSRPTTSASSGQRVSTGEGAHPDARSRLMSPSRSGSGNASPSGRASPLAPSQRHTDPGAPAQAASDAAARFKSWAIGGWDRLQEAMAAPPPPTSSGGGSDGGAADDSLRPQSIPDRQTSRAAPPLNSHNPWAGSDGGGQSQGREAGSRTSTPYSQPSQSQSQSQNRVASNPWRDQVSSHASSTQRRSGPSQSQNGSLESQFEQKLRMGSTHRGGDGDGDGDGAQASKSKGQVPSSSDHTNRSAVKGSGGGGDGGCDGGGEKSNGTAKTDPLGVGF